MGPFHKALPNVKSAYVTLQDFTPNTQKIYTDISVISVTLCNSDDKYYWWCMMMAMMIMDVDDDDGDDELICNIGWLSQEGWSAEFSRWNPIRKADKLDLIYGTI